MSAEALPFARFRLGRIVATPDLLRVVPNLEIFATISRHQAGDWGEVTAEDREANERALQEGNRLVSIYRSAEGVKFYIITEADRSHTTVLLPHQY
jgi:hypothetical protein